MPYYNADGLYVYNPGESRVVQGGEYPGAGPDRTIEVEIAATSINQSAASPTPIGRPFIIIPRNSTIEQIEILTETAVTSAGTPTLNVGLQKFDNTELDYDGLIAAWTVPLGATGRKTVFNQNSTGAGALVGTETLFPGYLDIYSSAAFTAGYFVIRVKLYVKDVDQLPANF